jgi:Na+-translocating ferredoxin:NAD+ oxidoreductase RnfG subunit
MKRLAKLVLVSTSVLLLGVQCKANDISDGNREIKDFDKYYINYNNAQCEMMPNDKKTALFNDIANNKIVFERVVENETGFFIIALFAENKNVGIPPVASVVGNNGKIKIFLFTSYAGCVFGKDVMQHKATAGDIGKYINLKDPKN